MNQLDQIKNRLAAATPGPWANETYGIYGGKGQYDEIIEREVDCMSYCYGGTARMIIEPANRELIANAPTDLAALITALESVMELHKPEKRWMPYDGADVSFDTEAEALESLDDVDVSQVVLESIAENGAPYFEVCAHCKTIEEGVCEGQCTQELGYRESIWPCPTIQAITKTLPTGNQEPTNGEKQ